MSRLGFMIGLALLVASGCGDSEPCDDTGGTGGFGGAGGAGGEAGVGGAGGATGDPRGELIKCDVVQRTSGTITERARIEGAPGDVATISYCYWYVFENGNQRESGNDCVEETHTFEEGEGEYVFTCTDLVVDYEQRLIFDTGFEEVWVRFEEAR